MRPWTFIACFMLAGCTHSVFGPADNPRTDREVLAPTDRELLAPTDSLVHDDNVEHWIAVKSTVQSYEVMPAATGGAVAEAVMVAPLIQMVETSTSAWIHIDTI